MKTDKAHIKSGHFEGIIDRNGNLVNMPHITVWSPQNIRDYIKFLEKLLPYLE